jgi:hypothetical protein
MKWVAIVVALAACKGKETGDGDKAKQAEAPPPAEKIVERIPAGPVPVALPRVPAANVRHLVGVARGFVTIAKDGAATVGKVTTPGDAPYKGEPFQPGRTLEEQLAGPAPSPDAAPARAQGQYRMKNPQDDPQLARQQAIDAARSAGILGALDPGTADLDSALLGFEKLELTATRMTAEVAEVLVLADATSNVAAITDLVAAFGAPFAYGVDAGAGVDALPYALAPSTGTHGPNDPQPAVFIEINTGGVTSIDVKVEGKQAVKLDGAVAAITPDTIADAIRPGPMMPVAGPVALRCREETTVAQLALVLAGLGAANAREVRIEIPLPISGYGFGTIGTGRYGTLGSHTGGIGGVPAGAPTVRIGQPNATGDLDKAIIRRYIKRNIAKITYCYEKQLLVNDKLAGTVSTEFFIDPTGKVATASARGVDDEVGQCIAKVIKDIEFPKPKGGGGVLVRYPFTLSPK